jgi:SAM-dependent methyltransferase
MKLLNLACGATRHGDPWVNVDELHATLLPGTPERNNLDNERNYVNWNLLNHPLPFANDEFSGILASHCIEHFDAKQAVKIMQECHRILQPGGALMVSAPDASYFRLMHSADNAENAVELFGEPIYLPDGETTFFDYALWNRWHLAIMSEDTLWSYFRKAGFLDTNIERISAVSYHADGICKAMHAILNRRLFSLVMIGTK